MQTNEANDKTLAGVAVGGSTSTMCFAPAPSIVRKARKLGTHANCSYLLNVVDQSSILTASLVPMKDAIAGKCYRERDNRDDHDSERVVEVRAHGCEQLAADDRVQNEVSLQREDVEKAGYDTTVEAEVDLLVHCSLW